MTQLLDQLEYLVEETYQDIETNHAGVNLDKAFACYLSILKPTLTR